MRLRNVPKSEEILSESPYYVSNPSSYKGQWNRVFANENPIYVEVGSGKGQFLIESAKQYPNINFVGMEMYSSVLYKATKKLLQMGEEAPQNLRFLWVDVREIGEIFEKGEIAKLYANFSDPWPKARHAKRRLSAPPFLALYEKTLVDGGYLEFKTDNRPLFEYSIQSFEGRDGWEVKDITFDLHHNETMCKGNIMTEYESKFVAEGKPICKLVAKLLILVLSILLGWACPTQNVSAKEVWPSGIEIESESMVVMEAQTGTVLLDKKPKQKKYPASITKILTALIAIENSDLDETVTFSEDSVTLNEGDTSHISRDIGEKMTMEECLYGMLLESANECAWAIAEHVAGGNVKEFVSMMNERAERIGCVNSHFSNPNGLPEEDHYTCSIDMAKIAREAFNNKTFREIIGTRAYNIPPTNTHASETPLNNHHAMLNFYKTSEFLYEGCLGGKTGYTDISRNTLVTYARRNGMTLICVIMDSPTPDFYIDTIHLFDYCFANFVTYSVAKNGGIAEATKKNTGNLIDSSEMFRVDDDVVVTLPKTASILDATMEVLPLSKPKDGVVGTLVYEYGGHSVGGGKLRFAAMDEGNAYPFHNQTDEMKDDNVSYIYVDFLTIGRVLVAAVGVVAALLLIRAISPSLHQRRVRKKIEKEERKPKYTVIRNNDRRLRRKK